MPGLAACAGSGFCKNDIYKSVSKPSPRGSGERVHKTSDLERLLVQDVLQGEINAMARCVEVHWVDVAPLQLEATDEVGVNFLDQLDVACLTLHLHLLDDLGLLLICQPRCGGHLHWADGLGEIGTLDILEADGLQALESHLLCQEADELGRHRGLQRLHHVKDLVRALHICKVEVILHQAKLLKDSLIFVECLDLENILHHCGVLTFGYASVSERFRIGHSRAEGLQVGSVRLTLREAALLSRHALLRRAPEACGQRRSESQLPNEAHHCRGQNCHSHRSRHADCSKEQNRSYF
mmetsp:Transcript_69470/g.165619  ORF Transcript_69470/g.165619 Transcript_69470/m.165619 type:complete len:295 (-) Transcript_69470:35-919(-)